MMARAGRELAIAERPQLTAQRRLAYFDLSRIEGLAAQSAGLAAVDPATLVERRRLDEGWIRAADPAARLSGARAQMGC
jgi:hypothetical protein